MENNVIDFHRAKDRKAYNLAIAGVIACLVGVITGTAGSWL